MVQPSIRNAKIGDLSAVVALYRQLNPADPVLDDRTAEAVWSELLNSGVTTVFVAAIDGLIISTCTLAIIPNLSRGARPYGVIENVVTDEAHRQSGLGGAVIHAALAKAWDANCYKVHLATGSKRETTLRFYERLGFKRDGKTYFEVRQT